MGWLQLLLLVEPAVPQIIADLKAVFARHPALSDPVAQAAFVKALADSVVSVADADIAKILADQAAHPQP